MEEIFKNLENYLFTYGLKVLGALAVLFIGLWLSRILTKIITKQLQKKSFDATIVKFLSSLVKTTLYAIVVIATLGQLEVETTSFVALIGAAGLAVGFALQGSLSNFAAGVMLIIFRPFKVGDFINAAGVSGTVEEVKMFITQLKTPDNKVVIVPNNKLTSDNITNFTTKDTRRVDMVFGIGYSDDIDKAKKIINDLLSLDDRVLKDPAPQIVVSELADSCVNITVRPWAKKDDYWGLYFDMTEKVKKEFDNKGVTIPFPQRDVHLFKQN